MSPDHPSHPAASSVPGRERFGLEWHGKRAAIHAARQPSTATLVPHPKASVGFEDTDHVFIEGDNLEVLRVLQKAYTASAKLIFIDPPYNTGHEFIYPDNYRDGLRDYLRYTGQLDDSGERTTTSTERGGRIHSRWLSMMYPRLFLARNLLQEDGAIFITIDDHEVHTLRLLLDEVFGPENFVTSLAWRRKVSPANDAAWFSNDHDHILVYARSKAVWRPNRLPRTAAQRALYRNPDADPRGPWSSATLTCNKSRAQRPNLYYAIQNPHTGESVWPETTAVWRYSPDRMQRLAKEDRIYWGADGTARPRVKKFLAEARGVVPRSVWDHSEVGSTQEATTELQALVPDSGFDTAKPVRLVQRVLQLATDPDADHLVLDFFAGSGTTGHAVMKQNAEDGGNRRFLTVQLPEPCATGRFDTIADVTRARLRAAAEQLSAGTNTGSIGFKAFRLAASHFAAWPAPAHPPLAPPLEQHAAHLAQDAIPDAILAEILLREGLPLHTPVRTCLLGGHPVHAVQEGRLLVCLASPITTAVLRAMMEASPQRVICLDQGFADNDQLLTNTVLEMHAHGVKDFRTV